MLELLNIRFIWANTSRIGQGMLLKVMASDKFNPDGKQLVEQQNIAQRLLQSSWIKSIAKRYQLECCCQYQDIFNSSNL